jgi:hypothetical protein
MWSEARTVARPALRCAYGGKLVVPKPAWGNAKPRLFLSHDGHSRINDLALAFCSGHSAGAFNPMLGYAAMNIAHRHTMAQGCASNPWTLLTRAIRGY